MKPRASIPTTLWISPQPASPGRSWCPAAIAATTAANTAPSASSGVMSLNTIPDWG